MPIDLTGITNENEFYTHHYLAAILEGDLKPLFEAWARQERPPWEALLALTRPFQAIDRESDPTERQALRQKWFANLLGVLGYELNPDVVELEDGTLLSLAGQITRANGQPELWILEALDGAEEDDPLVAQEEILTKLVFAAAEPPRWVLLYGAKQLLLLDRTKWPSKRFLRFDLGEIARTAQDPQNTDLPSPRVGLDLLFSDTGLFNFALISRYLTQIPVPPVPGGNSEQALPRIRSHPALLGSQIPNDELSVLPVNGLTA
jgi:hypothetical protein